MKSSLPQIKYEELEKYTCGAESEKRFLTKFQSGTVIRARKGDQEVVIKIWDNAGNLGNLQLNLQLMEERYLHKNYDLKGMPQPICFCEDDGHNPAIVYDINPLDTLHNLIPKDSFTWLQRVKVLLRFASILKSYQSYVSPFMICNIDAKHIMCDQEYNPMLYDLGMIDGGSLRRFEIDERKGSTGYIDPYVADGGKCSLKTDVFAYGVILLGLISKKVFDAETDGDSDFVYKWAEREYHDNNTNVSLVDPSFTKAPCYYEKDGCKITELAMQCIESHPDKRPSIEMIVLALRKLRIVRKHADIVGVQQ